MNHPIKGIVLMCLDQIVAGDQIFGLQDGAYSSIGIVREKQRQGQGYCLLLDDGQRISGTRLHSEWVRPRYAQAEKALTEQILNGMKLTIKKE